MKVTDFFSPFYEGADSGTWYHGTPELNKISKFEGRTKSISYLTDPQKWLAIQDKMSTVQSGSDEYMDLLHAAGDLMKHKRVRSPIFLSNNYPVAKTYADDRRAYDYQSAIPGVIPVEVAPGNALTINGGGQTFRGISIAAVRSGLNKAGIDEATVDQSLAQYAHDIIGSGNGNKISTDNLVSVVDELGFDIIDIIGIKDNYQGGGTPSTVRMVMDPSLIHIKKKVPGMAEDMDSANNMTSLLGRGPTIYPLPTSATEYKDIDSIPRGGKKKLKIRRRAK
jgi:hypothetical protein